jgi:tRNA threonylcarbamoyladenosine biosynthesis protein TsaE
MNSIEYSLNEIAEWSKKLLIEYSDYKIWLFEGEMGAGKTTLIKEICHNLGVSQNVSSPTFSIVNEYVTLEKQTIYHFDFYRLKHETEALDIGADEYFNSGNLCLIEWPSKIPSLIPSQHITIHLDLIDANKRKLFVTKS